MSTPQLYAEFRHKTFLVIDDFETMRALLRQILTDCGASIKNIDSADTDAAAIVLLEKNKYDVVLCDYNLGPGKNGQHILEEARHRKLIGLDCAWLMITAEKTNDVFMSTAECKPDDYLLKPITEAALTMRMAKIWARKEAFTEISAAIARHDYPEAIELCNDRLTFDQANAVDLLKLKACLLLDSGKVDEARLVFEKVISERNLPWAKVGLAKVMVREGGLNGARTLLENVIKGSSFYVEAYDLLAEVCHMQGSHDTAEEILERATRMSPNSVARQKMLGEVSFKLGKLEKAENAFRKSIGLGEYSVLKTPDSHIGLAKTCSAKGDPNGALDILDALNQEFDDETVRIKSMIAKGRIHQENGNPAQAREIARTLSEHIKNSPQRLESAANMEMAQLFLDIGEKDAAVNLLQEEVRNNTENGAILEQVKQVFIGAQMEEHGVALIESTRKSAIEQMNRGVLLAHEGKVEDAVIWMRNAREAMPTNVRVLFNLAYVLIAYLKKAGSEVSVVAEAREVLLRANDLAPGEKRFAQLMKALNQL